ncbi:LysR family transcriptional regulator [Pseudomonas sp. SWRI100]|uniref:LysR family transcriptional regulator n=1 Tax=Pseudomonas TaxID=286 RepID=UPI0016461F12|nr:MULTISPECIES: LysR family transcriptional regulator [Pseudomonas]MBC3485616.1 LysR family transcriptional regulator [Pseudomonas sp. SWRI50]MBC3495602.1 LysR family transcriptional regulator [Pseudomonas sp. SWRI67]MBV4526710.1 LysR family transcriptional regulator [Pseudomonas kermanshahensis]
MFDWEDLRHFSAFISAGSLSAAAKRLGVDHATVARRISSLEASLQLKLVDRRPRAYALTEQGVRVGEFAEQMLASSFALEHFASADQQAVAGEVVIAAPPALLGSMVARRLGELYKRYPALQLTLVGSKSRASLARREADVAITLARPTEPTLVASLLGHLEYRLYASAAYVRRREPHLYIGYDDSQAKSPQQRWLLEQAAGRPFALHSNDLRIQAQAAAGGVGVACLPGFMAEEYGLKQACEDARSMSIEIWLAVHEDVRNTPRIKAVTDFLLEQVKPLLRL